MPRYHKSLSMEHKQAIQQVKLIKWIIWTAFAVLLLMAISSLLYIKFMPCLISSWYLHVQYIYKPTCSYRANEMFQLQNFQGQKVIILDTIPSMQTYL